MGPHGSGNMERPGGRGMSPTAVAERHPVEIDGPSPLRVCLITEAAGGGVGRHFLDLAGGLASRGIDVTAIFSAGRCDASFRDRLSGITDFRLIELPMRRSI